MNILFLTLIDFNTIDEPGIYQDLLREFAKEDNWKYDLNKHDTKGWYYEDNGSIYWTKGMEGKLIYHKFRDVAEEKMRDWVEEFLISNLK